MESLAALFTIIGGAWVGYHVGCFVETCIRRPDIAKGEARDFVELIVLIILAPFIITRNVIRAIRRK